MKPVFSTVTVPVDGSPGATRGIAFALELAASGGTIRFCSIVDDSLIAVTAAEGALADVGPMIAEVTADAQAFCHAACTLAAAAGVAAEGFVLRGPCAAEIVGFAHRNGSQAIVLGTRGRQGFARALFGSVAEAVVRTSRLPVIVVHADDETRTGPVLVALDDSTASPGVLEVAMTAAAARGRSLAIVHVMQVEAPDRHDAHYLDDAFAAASKRGISASIVLVSGDPADQLLDTADRLEACMIVLGTHGRSFVPRLWLGSVAAAVVQRARVPVATVRQPRPAERSVAFAQPGASA